MSFPRAVSGDPATNLISLGARYAPRASTASRRARRKHPGMTAARSFYTLWHETNHLRPCYNSKDLTHQPRNRRRQSGAATLELNLQRHEAVGSLFQDKTSEAAHCFGGYFHSLLITPHASRITFGILITTSSPASGASIVTMNSTGNEVACSSSPPMVGAMTVSPPIVLLRPV